MAVSGHNGNNESLVGLSSSIGLTIFDDDVKEIQVTNSQEPIEVFIARDIHLESFYKFQLVNATQMKFSSKEEFYLFNSFNLTSENASIHIELKGLTSIGYVIVLKYGHSPIVNSTYADYDSFKIICPSKNLKKI